MSEGTLHMTDSIPTPTVEPQPIPPKTVRETDRVRAQNFRRMITLSRSVRTLPGGERLFVRFYQPEILEHWILLVNFVILAITGLLEMFANNRVSADLLAPVFRNMDNVRGLHNVAAVFYVGMMSIHAILVLIKWFVKREPPILVPKKQDWVDFLNNWKYLLRRNYPRPEFGRFTIDQKVTYWMTLSFSTLMLLSAFAMWFQTLVAQFLPEAIVPIARALHSMTGLLIIVTFLPWHIYHTVIKEQNASIFSGLLNEKTIRRNHPLDYRQILAAVAAVQSLSNKNSSMELQVLKLTEEQSVSKETPAEETTSDEQTEDTPDKGNPAQS